MTNKSYSYWQSSPSSFSKLYGNVLNTLSPSGIVSHFLNHRTQVLTRMLEPRKRGVLLDVGCGSGIHLVHFAPLFKKVVGVDYSDSMLDLARKELQHIPKSKWQLVNSDTANLPFAKSQFNVVIAMGLLDYVDSPSEVLRECRQVLKPQGTIIFSIPKKPSLFGFLRSPFGIAIKKYVFNLPPIDNTVSLPSLLKLLTDNKFCLQEIDSVWTAMWMVKAKAV